MENKFKQVIKRADIISYYFYMRIANILLRLIYKTNITPNIVTLFSIIIGIISGVAFAFHLTIIGILLFTLAYTLDCLDGQLARFHNLHSEFGLWFDNTGDRITEVAVIIGLSIGYLEHMILSSILVGLTLIYWYGQDILYHQNRLKGINKHYKGKLFILKLLSPFLSKGTTVLLLSLSPLLNIEYIFIFYIFIYIIKIPELIILEYKNQENLKG